MQSVVMMVSVSNASQVVAALDVFAVLLASLGHDLAHPGVTAAFLVQTRHELAMTYNDTSVLENMHTARLFGILKEQASNVLAALPESDWRDLRKTVVASVLATDMVHHFKMVSDVEVFCEMNEAALQNPEECAELFKTEKNTHFLLSLFIHSADIGNPAASWTSCERWAHRVMDEFFAQGDRERELGMPVSAMFDRETVVRPVMQVRGRARARARAVRLLLSPSLSLPLSLPPLVALAHSYSHPFSFCFVFGLRPFLPTGQLHRVRGGAAVRRAGEAVPAAAHDGAAARVQPRGVGTAVHRARRGRQRARGGDGQGEGSLRGV
jgi:hypothetical protein